MVVLDIFVLIRLRKSKQKVGAIVVNGHNQSKQKGQMTLKEYKFFKSTITIDFIFLAFYLPVGISFAINVVNLFYTSSNLSTNGTLESSILTFYSNVSQLFNYSYIIVVVLVSLSFNHLFRKEYKRIFHLRRRHHVSPANVTLAIPNVTLSNANGNSNTLPLPPLVNTTY